MIAVLLLLMLAIAPSVNAQAIGGAIALGGKPSAALILSPPATQVLTNVNFISVNSNSLGVNRLSLAIVQFNGTGATVTLVGNGVQNFTLVGCAADENLVKACAYQLINPFLSNQTVFATTSEIVGAIALTVLNFENVNISSPISGFVETGGATGPVTLSTSSAVGDIVISAFVSANNFINVADDTLITEAQPGSIIVTRIGQKPGATTVGFGATLLGSNAWNAFQVNVAKNP